MGALSKRIAEIRDATSEIVRVPEWDNVEIEVRSLTLGERNRITVASSKKGQVDTDRFYAAIIIATCWDVESGERAFSASDAVMLQGKSGGALDRLAKTAMRLSGLLDDETDAEDEDAESLDDLVESAGKGSSSTEASALDS